MSIKLLAPVTASSRGTVLVDKSCLWRGKPEKSLAFGKKSTGGRNNSGRVTVRHIGGGCKKKYRIIDFKRSDNVTAVVERIEYNPNATAFLALVSDQNGVKSYVLAPQGIRPGHTIASGNNVDILPGNCLQLKFIPVGSFVHNVELKPGNGGVIARSAGSYARILGYEGSYVLLKLRSGQVRLVFSTCRATIGILSNTDHKNIRLGKAGRNRWLGVRPSVRGVAMNPIDHPHGGGEGKTSGGRHPVTPWGVSTKGKKTRKRNKFSNRYIKGDL